MPWNNAVQLSDDQVEEELLLPMIEAENNHREIEGDWTCAGNTLVAWRRQRLGENEVPIFFICTIRKCLQPEKEIPSPD